MAKQAYLSLDKAIELGEYNPKVLGGFKEFATLSRHAQYQLIRTALKNRERHLWIQWAEINNQLNFSKKPYLQEGLDNITKQVDKVHDDEERLILEYSK